MLVVAVAIAVPLAVIRHRTAPTSTKPTACSRSRCVVVSVVLTGPPVTVFYGASCTGVHGSWFLNATQGGTTAVAHDDFDLRWLFASKSSVAMPSGTVTASGPGEKISVTIAGGHLTIAGTTAGKVTVQAAGTLSVGITGSAAAPKLTITETGLAAAEHALGLTSPFDAEGHPLTLSAKVVHRLAGCRSSS